MLGVEKDKFKGQFIFQSKKGEDAKKQVWKYDEEKRLVLTDGDTSYALVSVLFKVACVCLF